MAQYPGTGHPDVATAKIEHEPTAEAKRVVLSALDASGPGFVKPNVYDYTESAALAVVLVHPVTGAPYSATAGGGGGGGGPSTEVTSYIAASVTLYAVVDTLATVNIVTADTILVAGTVTANIVPGDTLTIAGTVTANLVPGDTLTVAGTVTANIVPGDTLTVSGTVTTHVAAGTVTANIVPGGTQTVAGTVTTHVATAVTLNTLPKRVGTEIRTRTVYIGTAAEQLPSLGSSDSGIAVKWKGTNTASVFIGPGSSVNGTVDDVNSGVELEPGDAATFPTDLSTDLWAITTATGVLTMFSVLE